MKRILRPAILAAALMGSLGVVSCQDYLDVTPAALYSPEDIFNSVSSATSTVLGAYDPLSGDQGYGIRLSMYYPFDTDEMLSSPGASDAGRRGISRYGAIPTNSEIARPWDNLYQGIERANICIKYIPQMSQYTSGSAADMAAVKRLHGEVLVLRAQYYLELIRNWGDVPAPFEPSIAGQNFNIPKTDRDEIYDQLLADLLQAEDLLPWRTELGASDERITKGAAKALRARMALYRGGYSERQNGQMERGSNYQQYYQIARDECAQLIARPDQHKLLPGAEDVWRAINARILETNEILFQVSAGGGNSNSDSKLGYYNGPRLNSSPKYGTSSGAVTALPNYFYAFDSTDTRRDLNVTKYTIESNDQQKATEILRMTDGKFRRDWRVPLLPGTAQNLGYNWPLIRFADVLLMFAEAENELNGPTTAAKAAFEEVRKRGLGTKIGTTPSDKMGFFNAIVKERALEFGGEGIRKYDLLRWNLLATKIAETKATLRAMQAEDGTGAYANIPLYMYYRVVSGEVQFLNSFYRPAPDKAPIPVPTVPGTIVTTYRINWRQALTGSSATTFIDNVAAEYKPNAGRELVPIPQTAIDTNPALVQNFGY